VACASDRFNNSERKLCNKLGGPLAGVKAGVKLIYLSTLDKVKVKQSRYRPVVAQRVPGSERSQIS